MTIDEAVSEGMEVTKIAAENFWYGRDQNARIYARAAIDIEDLIAHLRYYILTARYLPTVRVKPDFYTIKSFRSSLYSACKKALLTFNRDNVVSLKRGLALKDGARVDIDNDMGYSLSAPDDPLSRLHDLTSRPSPMEGDGMTARLALGIAVGCEWERLSQYLETPTFNKHQLLDKIAV